MTLHLKYLGGCEPHSCIKERLETLELRDSLRIYYEAFVELCDSDGDRIRNPGCDKLDDTATFLPKSALFEEVKENRAKLLCVFGGQGNTEDLLEELVDLEYTYQPLCRPFLKNVCRNLVNLSHDPAAMEYLSKGFDILHWIDDPNSRPPKQYLFSAAVSLPLVGLIQILNYHITCQILGKAPGQLRKDLTATTGHSQGIVSAAVISMSTTEEELMENTNNALQILFWIGLRSMQECPEVTLDPKIQADSIANGEGVPTPMLAVTNLTLQDLQTQVDISNKFLAQNEKIEISLHNGPRAFVCSGPPKSLYGLNLLLRKLKAGSSLDQSKIPFSERKLKFSTKFLPISSPFHCSYLSKAVDKIMNDFERNNLKLSPSSFSIPVIATDSGRLFGFVFHF
jgi:fatty acid synthase subunit beta